LSALAQNNHHVIGGAAAGFAPGGFFTSEGKLA
jgi:hypothetical protein